MEEATEGAWTFRHLIASEGLIRYYLMHYHHLKAYQVCFQTFYVDLNFGDGVSVIYNFPPHNLVDYHG